MRPGTFIGDTRKVSVKNAHAEDAPSFAAMEVTGAIIENKSLVYLVTRPTADSLLDVLFATEAGVPGNNGYGAGTWEPFIALLDDGATPAEGDRWGTKRDSWLLHQHYLGYTIQSAAQGSGDSLRACCREQVATQIAVIQLTSDLSAGGSASAIILWIIGGVPTASTMDAITVYDPPGMVNGTTGDRGYAYYDHQAKRWHVLNLVC